GIRDYKVTGVQTCALPIFGGICSSGEVPSVMVLSSTAAAARVISLVSWARCPFHPHWLLLSLWQFATKKWDVYNILWALVFGFRSEERRVGEECSVCW